MNLRPNGCPFIAINNSTVVSSFRHYLYVFKATRLFTCGPFKQPFRTDTFVSDLVNFFRIQNDIHLFISKSIHQYYFPLFFYYRKKMLKIIYLLLNKINPLIQNLNSAHRENNVVIFIVKGEAHYANQWARNIKLVNKQEKQSIRHLIVKVRIFLIYHDLRRVYQVSLNSIRSVSHLLTTRTHGSRSVVIRLKNIAIRLGESCHGRHGSPGIIQICFFRV